MQKPTPIISDSMKTILSSLLGFRSLDQDSMGNNSSAILESIYKLFTQIEDEKSLMFDITMKQRQLDAINENKRHKELMEIIESKNQSNQDQAKEIDKEQKKETEPEPEDSKTTKNIPDKQSTENKKSTAPAKSKTKTSKAQKQKTKGKSNRSKIKKSAKRISAPNKPKVPTVVSPKKLGRLGGFKMPSISMPEAATAATAAVAGVGAFLPSNIATNTNDTYSEADLTAKGFNISKGVTQKDKAYISPLVIRAADTIKNAIPGVTFTGFNDQFHHEKAPNSLHTKGLAVDFIIPLDIARDDVARKKLAEEIALSTGGKVIDEYAQPSAIATGGHFHLQFAGQRGVDPGTGKYEGKTELATPTAAPVVNDTANKISSAAKENKDLRRDIESTQRSTPSSPATSSTTPMMVQQDKGVKVAKNIPPAILQKSQSLSM